MVDGLPPHLQPGGEVLDQAAQTASRGPAQRTGLVGELAVLSHGEGVGPGSGQTTVAPVLDDRLEHGV